jgi:hypothetical protein
VAQTTIRQPGVAPASREKTGLRRLPLEPLALLIIDVAALALRLWPLRHYPLDFQDEGAYWQSLRAMAAGQPLFSVVFSSQPPFFLLGVFPFYLLFGQTLVAARLGVVLYSLLGLAASYYIGRAVAGRWAGVIACALLAVDPLYLAESHTLQAEMPSEGLALAGVALAAVAISRVGRQRRWRAAVSGVVLGLGVLTKLFDLGALVPAALYLTAPLFVVLWGERGRTSGEHRTDVREALRLVVPDLLLLAAGFVVACAAVLAPFFPVRGLVYDQVVRFHQVAEGTTALGPGGLLHNVGVIRDNVLGYYSIPYLLLVLAGVALAVWRRAWTLAPLVVWLVISLGLLVRQQPLIWHHVVLLAPLLALIAGAALPLGMPSPPNPLSRARERGRRTVVPRLPLTREGVETHDLIVGEHVTTAPELLAVTTHVSPHEPLLAGVWGEASPQAPPEGAGGAKGRSPQAPPEARWTAGRSRGASQPWAGGAKERGRVGMGSLTYALMALVCVAAFTSLWQSVDQNRFRVDTNPPPAALQRHMAGVLHDKTQSGALVVTDGQYIAGLADRSVPGELVDTSSVHIATGVIDPRYFSLRYLEDITTRDHVRTVLFATGRLDGVLQGFRSWVEQRYRLVASFGKQDALYQR